MLKIANIQIPSRLILAPISGVSDLPFRMISRNYGCQFAFFEMINARTMSYKGKKTILRLTTEEKDSPVGVQLLGIEKEYILNAINVLQKYRIDLLDFNAACPERKVVRRQEGAGLLRTPQKLHELLKEIVKNSHLPVTVKIRSGWDDSFINAREVALYAQDAGVSALFIHGRTKEQGYSGTVNYRVIKEVKDALSIPVIASGDIFSGLLAKKMFDETGCDGILVARGALGNPWIFREIQEYVDTGAVTTVPSRDEIIDTMIQHLDACVKLYQERSAVVVFRKFFIWYTKGFRKIRPIREKVSRVRKQEEMVGLIRELK